MSCLFRQLVGRKHVSCSCSKSHLCKDLGRSKNSERRGIGKNEGRNLADCSAPTVPRGSNQAKGLKGGGVREGKKENAYAGGAACRAS